MSFLLDTHVFLWLDVSSARLSKRAREIVLRSEQAVYVSAASFWEMPSSGATAS